MRQYQLLQLLVYLIMNMVSVATWRESYVAILILENGRDLS